MKKDASHFIAILLPAFMLLNHMLRKSGLMVVVQRVWLVFFLLLFFTQAAYSNHNDCGEDPNTFDVPVIQYQTGVAESYCVLCGVGQIRILITNPSTGDMENFSITHNFIASGLEYVPNSTTVSVNGAGAVATGDPDTSVPLQLTWDSGDIPALASISSSPNHFYDTVEIFFQVRSPAGTEEDLVDAVRNIQADAAYTFCPGTVDEVSVNSSTGQWELNIDEPLPTIRKRGRNIDAAQGGYIGGTSYGNINDDVIWQIRIRNNGRAALQDLLFDDNMGLGNFDINYICPTNGQAVAVANNDGVAPGGSNCIAVADGNVINDFDVNDPFGNPAGDEPGSFIDIPATANSFYYLVGKITNSCNPNTTNTADDVQWGCEGVGTQGGIIETSTNVTGGSSSTTLSSLVNNNGLQIQRELIGTNLSQPAGSKGTVRITITNNTGGSVKNINLTNTLPPEYVVDSSFEPTINMNPRFGNYAGMTDTITWTNPVANTDTYNPAVVTPSTDPLDYLANTAPEFSLTSTAIPVNPDYADQFNMMRHGDVITITFRVVMVPDTGYAPYDLAANLDVREENTLDGTDPANATTVTNQLDVTFEQFCNPGVTQTLPTFSDNFNTNPEDLDVDITGTELIFILTNDVTTPLPLEVTLTNNGGHDANDYVAYVTFGATMDVNPPPECSLTTNPPLLEVWDDPADLPATASVYACSSADIGSIGPNQTVPLNFTVTKSTDPADLILDDLSFRADVVGEVTLSDTTPLWFPVPRTTTTVPATQIDNRANNYSLDGLRARVIGFNLTKAQDGNCSETTYMPASDLEVQIGEECTYHIETGGWFGFQTPGFTYIAVQNINVWDQQPDGQAYISNTNPAHDVLNPLTTSDPEILSINSYPAGLTALFEGGPVPANWFGWTFNPVVPFVSPGHANRIIQRDKWFRVNTTTRLLNDQINSSAAPNLHAATSSNILNSTFQAVFFNDVLNAEEVFTLGQNTIGYPREALRRVDLTVTEPNINIVKEVCNETLNVVGPNCGAWTTLANDGDTEDSYIYRITITNQTPAASSVGAAPAYNLTSTDILDASDMMLVVDFDNDNLDNDGDGLVDGADINGEGSISDNIVENGTPATITFSHTHSDALLQIDPDTPQPIYFYYRVNPDDSIAPGQQLTNTVNMTYDTLDGDTGSQTVDPRPNGEIGGARVYTTADAQATVEILPLITQPKTILNLSNTTITGAQPQGVSIGEEIEYQLQASIPVAKLDNFEIRDELPAGISCIEVPEVVLDTTYFSPGGTFNVTNGSVTCNDNLVHWNFGDQELIGAPDSTMRFDFVVSFIARVENSAANINNITISNGTPATTAYLRYTNDDPGLPAQVTLNYGQHDILIQEPTVVLTKNMEVASADASDVITVTVTAQNTGTATAYNLRMLDDLLGSNLTYLGNIGGTDPPDSVDIITFGANQPVFIWNALAPGTTYTFTFDVSVDLTAQPDEILDNTIQADWTSLPGRSTALNSSGLIGENGSTLGMRIGALPNANIAPNIYEATAAASATVPPLTITKTDLNPAMPAEIGAHRNFQVEIILPEGTTNNLLVTDNLAFGGQSYVLSDNVDFDVTYTFLNIASINGQDPDLPSFDPDTVFTTPADGTSGNAVWNIGTVVTDAEDDTTVNTVNPVIRINYYARLNNDLTTGDGDTLQNYVDVNYTNGESGATETLNATTAAVTAIEPVLTVAKVVAPPTPVTGSDIIQYTITITNTGNATAYDVNIVDTLPAELAWSSTTSAQINSVDVTGFNPTPIGAPGGPLIWGRGNGDESLDIPVSGVLVLVYEAQVQPVALPGVIFNNSVTVDWTSLDGSSSYERDGAGCPTVSAPDIYCAGPVSADVSIVEPENITLVKSGPATLGVGVPASFTLNVQNTGGAAAYDATITDLIPNPVPGGMCDDTPPGNFNVDITQADLTLVSTLSQGIDYTVNFVVGSPTCTLTFTIVSPVAALPADYRYIITYDAYLDADTANNIPLTNIAGVTEWFNADTSGAGATGTTRTYTRVLTDGTTSTLDHQDAYTLTTEPPAIVVRKEVTNVTTSQTPGLTATPGDRLQYQITITNQGTIALADFSLTDEIDRLNGAAMFAPGIENIVVSIPADISNTTQTGGTYATGALDVRNLVLGAAGSGTETVTITFDAILASSIPDGTIVYNQAELLETNAGTIPSDYEGDVNGNDPTPITITSAPQFQVQKISDDITGLPNELQPGDTLRYTITVKNIGTEDALNASLRDLLPVNTTYVANSTTLNGAPVADPVPGVLPLEVGILINAPEDITPGNMRADATTTTTNVATIVFDVTINSDVLEGTIISNQGYVNAEGIASGPILEQPSDDPGTIIPDDPTLDIVGTLPLVDAQKTVELYDDVNDDGDIDPGDTLRYTIIVTNSGAVPATGVRLVDTVPVSTTYVANSTYLNTDPVGQPDSGISPLATGIDISSDDQAPPTPGNGYLSVGGVATIIFDVTVDVVAEGTIISNQGIVSSNEQADELTDADGDDSNGDQPTLSVVGNVEQLTILKQVSVVGGGPALPGSELEYVVTVTNVGLIPATDVVITDDLSLPVAGQKSFVINSATMNGVTTGVSYAAPVIRAEYSANYGDLLPGQTITLRFRALLDAALVVGTTVTNIADVYWDDPDPGLAQTVQASVSIDIGATPGFGTLTGQLWHDTNFNNALDGGERILEGWTVELLQNGNLIGSVLTDASGIYQIPSVSPNYISLVPYEIRFVAPGATTTTALLGYADANPLYGYTNGLQYISDIVDIAPGVVRTNLNLPIDPNGVVYNSVVRTPVAGATLTMTDIAGNVLPDNCFVDAAQQGQVTLTDGYYKFDINFIPPECPPGNDYIISVTPPANDYIAGESTIIPASSSVATPYSVPTCTGDPLPTTQCEVQTLETAPAVAITAGAPETDYYLHLTLSDGVIPDDSQIFNNHIPLDPDLAVAIGISKVTPLVNVTRGELVPYTITIINTLPVPLNNVTLTDTIPAGFKYVEGSARLDGVAVEPTINGLQLNWVIPTVDAEARYTVKLLLVVGAGVQEGEYINRAQAFSTLLNSNVSEQASATVRVVPDPVFDCSDIIGKVFDDKNLNGQQDDKESGIQGVRLATARGLLVTTDKHGRFHITCAATPDEQRGSNFIVKLDERTLPSGHRVTTENPRVQRLTRGKMIKFNFGATVHRAVRLDIADGVFEKDSDQIRPQWLSRVGLLIEELRKAPSVLRLTYLGDIESAGLVDDRLDTLRNLIKEHWEKINSYKLVIEQEIFWRNGGPNGGGGLD